MGNQVNKSILNILSRSINYKFSLTVWKLVVNIKIFIFAALYVTNQSDDYEVTLYNKYSNF